MSGKNKDAHGTKCVYIWDQGAMDGKREHPESLISFINWTRDLNPFIFCNASSEHKLTPSWQNINSLLNSAFHFSMFGISGSGVTLRWFQAGPSRQRGLTPIQGTKLYMSLSPWQADTFKSSASSNMLNKLVNHALRWKWGLKLSTKNVVCSFLFKVWYWVSRYCC